MQMTAAVAAPGAVAAGMIDSLDAAAGAGSLHADAAAAAVLALAAACPAAACPAAACPAAADASTRIDAAGGGGGEAGGRWGEPLTLEEDGLAGLPCWLPPITAPNTIQTSIAHNRVPRLLL